MDIFGTMLHAYPIRLSSDPQAGVDYLKDGFLPNGNRHKFWDKEREEEEEKKEDNPHLQLPYHVSNAVQGTLHTHW